MRYQQPTILHTLSNVLEVLQKSIKQKSRGISNEFFHHNRNWTRRTKISYTHTHTHHIYDCVKSTDSIWLQLSRLLCKNRKTNADEMKRWKIHKTPKKNMFSSWYDKTICQLNWSTLFAHTPCVFCLECIYIYIEISK